MIPDWQLPPGVTRALWEQLHDPDAARAYDARLRDTPLLERDIAFVLEHCQPPGRLIDLGCGTGRLCLELAGRGYSPVGVDLSPEMLRVAAEKASTLGIHLPLVQANLVQLDAFADASFDHAACLFSTLGLIAGADHRLTFLRHVHRLLRPGGKLVLHLHNRWFLLGTRHGRRLLARNLFRGDFLMPPHAGAGPIPMHLFRRTEIRRLLRAAGFRLLDVLPVGAGANARLHLPWLLPGLRAYGFLVAARK